MLFVLAFLCISGFIVIGCIGLYSEGKRNREKQIIKSLEEKLKYVSIEDDRYFTILRIKNKIEQGEL